MFVSVTVVSTQHFPSSDYIPFFGDPDNPAMYLLKSSWSQCALNTRRCLGIGNLLRTDMCDYLDNLFGVTTFDLRRVGDEPSYGSVFALMPA